MDHTGWEVELIDSGCIKESERLVIQILVI